MTKTEYQKLKNDGICIQCKTKKREQVDKSRCNTCLEMNRKSLLIRSKYRADHNLCRKCGKAQRIDSITLCNKCYDRKSELFDKIKISRKNNNQCINCGNIKEQIDKIRCNKCLEYQKEHTHKFRYNNLYTNQCVECNKIFKTTHEPSRFCSKKCFGIWRSRTFRGENACRWIEDRSQLKKSINATIRQSIEYKGWRNKIFQRDDYTCQICHKRGFILNAHHIHRFSENKDLRFDINNGITLCKNCHNSIKSKEEEYVILFENILV